MRGEAEEEEEKRNTLEKSRFLFREATQVNPNMYLATWDSSLLFAAI